MPRMKILNPLELESFQRPPQFNAAERKKFFEISAALQKTLNTLRSPTNKACFILAYGYFRAAKTFFQGDYCQNDFDYVIQKLGVSAGVVKVSSYDKQTTARHQRLIREYCGFQEFDDSAQELACHQIRALVRSQTRPKMIFLRLLDYLVRKKIEIPSYNQLSSLILFELNGHKRELIQAIEDGLSSKSRKLLDSLLDKEPDQAAQKSLLQRFRLTLLKKFHHSTKPSKIQENVEDQQTLCALYSEFRPLLQTLDLSDEGVRYFATTVLKTRTFQLLLKSDDDRYLHLIAFIAHQYFKLQDALVDAYLLSVRNVTNKAQRIHKERCYEERPERNRRLHSFVKAVGASLISPIKRIASIVNSAKLSDTEKVARIKQLFARNQQEQQAVQQQAQDLEKEVEQGLRDSDYFSILESRSRYLQNRVSLVVKHIEFEHTSSAPGLIEAIEHFKARDGKLTKSAPTSFLDRYEREAVSGNEKFRISLYKVFLFIHIANAIKAGTLNLKSSYKYRPLDNYLIPKSEWRKNRERYLKQADLVGFGSCPSVLEELRGELDELYRCTNENILEERNKHIKFRKNGSFVLATPGAENSESAKTLSEFFPKKQFVSLVEVLSTVDSFTGFLDELEHMQVKYDRKSPSKKTLIAGIVALGCFIGTRKFSMISKELNEFDLEHTVNWRFSVDTVANASDKVLELMDRLELPNIYRRDKDKLHTSSDGQKFEVAVDSLNAGFSFKYFGQRSGVSACNFLDERHFLFHSDVFSAVEREAAYVIDGLMHNDVVKSNIHSTDTHGYSEIVFGATHLLGFSFAPRIKSMSKQQIYSLSNRKQYAGSDYKILPDKCINPAVVEQNWDDILRFIATIKLKHTTASQLFRRLNSYSREHHLYRALKTFGKIIKSRFILHYIDDLKLRQAIEKQLNKSENSNKFSRAVSFGSQEFLQAEKEEQQLAENCRRLIKNSIICWNYLFLSQKLSNESDKARRAELLSAIKNGSVVTWQHVNLHGEYDFSDERLRDSVGLKPPNILPLKVA